MGTPIKVSEENHHLNLSIGARTLTITNGDILSVKADALVCPVDPSLDFKTGLAHVISQAAGKQFRAQRPTFPEPYGKVVVLPGGDLRVKYVFLTVLLGERGVEKIKFSIRQALNRTIRYAEFLRLNSIAFPVLGSPIASPSYDLVAHEMLEHAALYFRRRNTKLKSILVSAFNGDAYQALKKEALEIADQ